MESQFLSVCLLGSARSSRNVDLLMFGSNLSRALNLYHHFLTILH